MRLWTVHPKYLDAKGLVALWREGLLAQKVLRGKTRGYRRHPQLIRFRAQANPVGAIAGYLRVVQEEATRRGYRFDRRKIARQPGTVSLVETRDQLRYEWNHLLQKLKRRAPDQYTFCQNLMRPEPHPIFKLKPGPVQDWETGAKKPE